MLRYASSFVVQTAQKQVLCLVCPTSSDTKDYNRYNPSQPERKALYLR